MKLKAGILLLFVLLCIRGRTQILYLQENFKGGAAVDGHSYEAMSYFNYDTINFQNAVPVGSTIRKALLISNRGTPQCTSGKDTPTQFKFNNHLLQFDSSDIVSNLFYCNYQQVCPNWMLAKDVTSLTLNTGNQLIMPFVVNTGIYTYYTEAQFLIILYDNSLMPTTNVAVILNNQTFVDSMNYKVNNLNPVNSLNDVGLSILPMNTNNAYSVSIGVTSSLGTYTVGDLYASNYLPNIHTAPGSFYYQNNTLSGLVDDTPDSKMDSTDALANIKNFVPNGATSFTINSNLHATSFGCIQTVHGFILAYSTPCPPSQNTPLQTHTICGSGAIQMNAGGFNNSTYHWQPVYALSDSLIRNPVANPTVTTNYVVTITDSNGCHHTEAHKVLVDKIPQIDSIKTQKFTCGVSGGEGSATIFAHSPGIHHYTYNIGAGVQWNNAFTNLQSGSYTVIVQDTVGCSAQQSFTIPYFNPVTALFTLNPDTVCNGTTYQVVNGSTGANSYNWYLNDTLFSTVQNPIRDFTSDATYGITLIAYENSITCSDTATHALTVLTCSIGISAPNIFTPNSDGLNDTWQLIISESGSNAATFETLIFDRWGIKVFESTDSKRGWDGHTTSGLECVEGTYYYIVKYRILSGKSPDKEEVLKGFLQLVR